MIRLFALSIILGFGLFSAWDAWQVVDSIPPSCEARGGFWQVDGYGDMECIVYGP